MQNYLNKYRLFKRYLESRYPFCSVTFEELNDGEEKKVCINEKVSKFVDTGLFVERVGENLLVNVADDESTVWDAGRLFKRRDQYESRMKAYEVLAKQKKDREAKLALASRKFKERFVDYANEKGWFEKKSL